MKCIYIKEMFVDYLSNEINRDQKQHVQEHLADCQECRTELQDLNEIWIKLGILPQNQPDPVVRKNFYAMLESYKEGMEINRVPAKRPGFAQKLQLRFPLFKPALQFAMVPLLLLLGIVTGLTISSNKGSNSHSDFAMNNLSQEANQMRQMISLSLLDQSSASDRISGVMWSTKVANPDQRIIDRLLELLNQDPNINVRLSVLDSLYLFSSNPKVKEALADSIQHQESPLVQVALIDLISAIREKKAIKALKALMEKKDVNESVREKASMSIKELM